MILVQKGWVFYKAIDDTEVTGLYDMPTVFRSLSRDGAVAKVKRRRERLRRRNAWVPGEDCWSCGEKMPVNECPDSRRSCGHHCNHSWSHDACDWCGAAFADLLGDEK